ncbi:MAG: hypothetical protein H6Q76_419 [Firmicutes bacterium]|nr:hypothetical protein [Bacillota bacterium]
MKLKAAFLFVAPEADPAKHRSVIDTPIVELTAVGVKNYTEAMKVAAELVAEGVSAIELCGGFGIDGVELVKRAVAGKAVIGVVRFDIHPGLECKSGDDIFK